MSLRLLLALSLLALATPVSALTVYKYTDANGVVTYTDKKHPGAQIFQFGPEDDRSMDVPGEVQQQVRLDTLKRGNMHTLQVYNEMHAPVEVELRLSELDNVGNSVPQRQRWIIPARSQSSLLSLLPKDPARAPSYKASLSHAIGDPRLLPKPYRYPLPWRGGPFAKTQGANGSFSHNTPKGRYAVDIAMPEGTPLVAARAGVVVSTLNTQSGAGPNPAGNYVRVLHDDGTMAVYLHLQRGSVNVQPGQRIGVGTPIARSGNTGRSTGPHLHFVVQRNLGLAVESIPFDFSQPVNSLPNFAVGGN
jgi:murein DD-endopeptidase MepM/ murein hydrolase activator NlpD